MEKQPLLQFYTDEEWGYNIWDEEIRKRVGISVKFQQEENETRAAFFKRLGFEPKVKMYGSDLEKDKEVRSWDWNVRLAAAHQGYGLDVLVYDDDLDVRYEVACQGYGLDILVHDDEDPSIRQEVARQGYGLDILVRDESWLVRQAVAGQGFGLDILVQDEEPLVRQIVAGQGFGLDILVHDENWRVRTATKSYLKGKGYPSIESWIEDNPKKVADKKNKK